MAVRYDLDLLVCGGGPAGIAAAIAGARSGLRTGLVEWHGFLGGSRTAVGVDTFYGFWTPGEEARPVVGGIGLEIVERVLAAGAFRRMNTYGAGPGVTYDTELLKLQLDELALEADVQLHYHSIVIGVEPLEEGWLVELAGATSGTRQVTARYLIDATGDATAAGHAGAEFTNAYEEGLAQGLTTIFFMAGVDVETAMSVSHAERSAMIAEADRSGAYRLPRHEGSLHRTPHPGVLQANIVRVSGIDATDPAALTRAEIEGRKQAYEYLRFFRDRLPGCENAYIIWMSHQIGIRETRRIVGLAKVVESDVLEGRRDDQGIALCAAPIEDHKANSTDTRWQHVGGDGIYSIPYGSLVPRGLDSLWVAGRCISASHAAQASLRNAAQAFATGEAAGRAAALAKETGSTAADLDVAELRRRIVEAGGIL
jgi:hypothetical protein